MKPFAELDIVQLQQAHPEFSLLVGAVGTAVLVYRQGEAYEVEFARPDGSTQALLTLPATELGGQLNFLAVLILPGCAPRAAAVFSEVGRGFSCNQPFPTHILRNLPL